MIDIRDAVFGQLYTIMERDSNVVVVTADMSCFTFNKIQDRFPDRVINVGIAEQNMISVAAGMALDGRKVVCYGIAAFLIYRALDQIRLDIVENHLPIVLIGDGAGYTYKTDGASHHAIFDDVVMWQNMSVYSPEPEYAGEILDKAMKANVPCYIRLVR